MDQIDGTSNTSNLTPESEEDHISRMPKNVITHILERVPIQYAVRTSILSRKWRFEWTMLSKIEFDGDFPAYLRKKGIEDDLGRIVTRILFHHIGDISKFSVTLYENLDAEYINDWVMLLSRNRIKDLSIWNFAGVCKVPTHLFSCLELENLELSHCYVSLMPPTFHGFPNLEFLYLNSVVLENYTYGELLTRCPSLEVLSLISDTTDGIKGHEIAKLENLTNLRLPLCALDNMAIITSSDVLQHMSLFYKVQDLFLDLLNCKVLAKDKERFETFLPCVKNLVVYNMDFSCANLLSLVYALIFASQNARTLKITTDEDVIDEDVDDMDKFDYLSDDVNDSDDDMEDADVVADIDGCKMGQLQLREVSIEYVTCSENEVMLLKSILSSSPLLKEMNIFTSEVPSGLIKLLKLHRASPNAEVNFFWT
ncbi:F-box protein At4g09920-like [Rutidosis leptorrhynchoides]|uniref:F-box protein At4g09920-like n=1 Tax=Rutidosis leptorrhynchoides TaxID=125765 RepID=UPI003A994E69